MLVPDEEPIASVAGFPVPDVLICAAALLSLIALGAVARRRGIDGGRLLLAGLGWVGGLFTALWPATPLLMIVSHRRTSPINWASGAVILVACTLLAIGATLGLLLAEGKWPRPARLWGPLLLSGPLFGALVFGPFFSGWWHLSWLGSAAAALVLPSTLSLLVWCTLASQPSQQTEAPLR